MLGCLDLGCRIPCHRGFLIRLILRIWALKSWDPGSGFWNLNLGILRFGMQDSLSQRMLDLLNIKDLGSRILGSRIWDLESESWDAKIWDAGLPVTEDAGSS